MSAEPTIAVFEVLIWLAWILLILAFCSRQSTVMLIASFGCFGLSFVAFAIGGIRIFEVFGFSGRKPDDVIFVAMVCAYFASAMLFPILGIILAAVSAWRYGGSESAAKISIIINFLWIFTYTVVVFFGSVP